MFDQHIIKGWIQFRKVVTDTLMKVNYFSTKKSSLSFYTNVQSSRHVHHPLLPLYSRQVSAGSFVPSRGECWFLRSITRWALAPSFHHEVSAGSLVPSRGERRLPRSVMRWAPAPSFRQEVRAGSLVPSRGEGWLPRSVTRWVLAPWFLYFFIPDGAVWSWLMYYVRYQPMKQYRAEVI